MTWKISLPMYNVSPRLERCWDALAEALVGELALVRAVEWVRSPSLPQFWQRHDILFSQTCGYPYATLLRGLATPIATPCFDLPGCDGGDYSSVIVTRSGAGIESLDDARSRVAAVNDAHSHSGMNALRHAVAPLARDGGFFGAVKWSGSHAESLRMVREGEADIAAIDCVTHAYIGEEYPERLQGIRVLGYTASAPGLPLIAGQAVPAEFVARLRAALAKPGPSLREQMNALHISAFSPRSDADYDRIMAFEAQARAAGYPTLA